MGATIRASTSRDEALAMAEHGEVTIYAISTNSGTVAGMGVKSPSQGDKVLSYLAQQTGGHAFFPFAASDLTEDFQEISRELRSQYSLAYIPANRSHDGTFRRISVEAHNKEFHVHAKSGYFYQ